MCVCHHDAGANTAKWQKVVGAHVHQNTNHRANCLHSSTWAFQWCVTPGASTSPSGVSNLASPLLNPDDRLLCRDARDGVFGGRRSWSRHRPVARLYGAMFLLWHAPGLARIPIVYVVFIPSVFYTLARGRTDVCSAFAAASIQLRTSGNAALDIEFQRYIFKAPFEQRPTDDHGPGLLDARELLRRFPAVWVGQKVSVKASGVVVPIVITSLFILLYPGLDDYLHRYEGIPPLRRDGGEFVRLC